MSANLLVAPHSEALTESYFDFQPDLIIEATNACNRACQGCYAANILVNKNQVSPSAKFLRLDDLDSAFGNIGHTSLTSIRGGEPSIHPDIDKILGIAAKNSKIVVLETHGRWIKPDATLLAVCKELGIHIKVSFDSMHGLSADQLYDLHTTLAARSIKYLVAITESSYATFIASRILCPWISNNQIIFQKKVKTLDELFKPTIGVVKTDGSISRTLSVKKDFLNGRDDA
jgi:organic radical activating enzyme